MKSYNLKSIYSVCICAGAVLGPLFPVCFSAIFGDPVSQKMADFVAYVSMPVFYLLGNILHTNYIPFGILLIIGYWAILGMGVSCLSVWLFTSTIGKESNRRRTRLLSTEDAGERNDE